MRLHSDFHDYYDSSLGYGIDDTIYYRRFTEKAEIGIRAGVRWPRILFAGLLGFCGRLYPFVEVLRHERIVDAERNRTQFRVVETYYAFSSQEYVTKHQEFHARGGWFNPGEQHKECKQFLEEWSIESDEIFLEHKVPVWVLPRLTPSSTDGLLNPPLRDFGFERIKSAVAAYQDISLYLASMLAGERSRTDIEDIFKIEQHGFDQKTSFRKTKQK